MKLSRSASRFGTVAMAVLLAVMASVTISSLLWSRTEINRLQGTLNASDAYNRTALNAALAAAYGGDFTTNRHPDDFQAFLDAVKKTFEYEALAKSLGTEEDRLYLDQLEAKYAAEMVRVLVTLNGGSPDAVGDGGWGDPSAVLADITEALTQPAEAKREAALRDLDSVKDGIATRSIVVIVAFAFGMPLVIGSYLLTRHYERKDTIREVQLALLREAARTDALTGLANHRAFQDDLRSEIARAASANEPIAVAILDVDDFKEINDSEGHARGDAVLAELAQTMSVLPPGHKAYRIGGDEFALIMRGSTDADALEALERLRKAIAAAAPDVSVSIGFTATESDYSVEPLRDRADALYEAKRLGKDRVVRFEAGLHEAEAA